MIEVKGHLFDIKMSDILHARMCSRCNKTIRYGPWKYLKIHFYGYCSLHPKTDAPNQPSYPALSEEQLMDCKELLLKELLR